MAFPSEKELKKVRKKLEKAMPSLSLPENATKAEILKYELCRKFVIYLQDHDISKTELALELGIDKSRLTEIVKYRIDLFSADKLIEFAQRLDPNLEIRIA